MMILADVRTRLTRTDAQLVLRLLSRGRADEYERVEATLADRGLDPLLDDPRLLPALLEAQQGAHASLPLFMYVVVRNALRDAGEDDRVLADYLASVAMHFGIRDRANRIADSDDEVYHTLVDLLAAVESADARRSFLVRTHLGNYALWLSGLFSDTVEQRRWRRGGPDLDYYEELGRRAFRLAGEHRLAAEHGMVALFAALAERFGVLRSALSHIGDTMLFPHHHTPERLMRQVRDATMYRLST
jgi:hypothetical protein